MIEHTPGPWKARLHVHTSIGQGHIICTDYGAETPVALLWVGGGTHGKPRQLANAHLIARAPALLAALQRVVEARKRAIEAVPGPVGIYDDASAEEDRAFDEAKELLATLKAATEGP